MRHPAAPRGPWPAAVALFSVLASGFRCGGPIEATLGKRFTLKPGQGASLPAEKVLVAFVTVSEDSRCPKGVQCITEGNARVILEVSVGSRAPSRVELNTGRGSKEADVAGFRLALEGLAPEPPSGRAIRPEDYLATLSVHRL